MYDDYKMHSLIHRLYNIPAEQVITVLEHKLLSLCSAPFSVF